MVKLWLGIKFQWRMLWVLSLDFNLDFLNTFIETIERGTLLYITDQIGGVGRLRGSVRSSFAVCANTN